MAIVDALQQVALPEQRIIVQVGNKQTRVQFTGLLAGAVGSRVEHPIEVLVHISRDVEEYRQAGGGKNYQGN